jgi:tyrosinase
VSTLSSSSRTIQTLINAVTAFKQQPSSSQYNWANLANIHHGYCAHNNWYFLPWHRPYIGYYEYLIQTYTKNPNFALPYWNWTNNPKIPSIFFTGALNDPTRLVGPNDQLSSNWVGSSVMSNIIATQDFQAFASSAASNQFGAAGYGALEATPHNNVHDWIGGDMGAYYSPLDPLFWLHHCNLDRLWVVWNNKYANTTDSSWLNYTLQYGVPAIGSWSVSQTLSTSAMGYVYDKQTSVT